MDFLISVRVRDRNLHFKSHSLWRGIVCLSGETRKMKEIVKLHNYEIIRDESWVLSFLARKSWRPSECVSECEWKDPAGEDEMAVKNFSSRLWSLIYAIFAVISRLMRLSQAICSSVNVETHILFVCSIKRWQQFYNFFFQCDKNFQLKIQREIHWISWIDHIPYHNWATVLQTIELLTCKLSCDGW